jgi:hypothetical protein
VIYQCISSPRVGLVIGFKITVGGHNGFHMGLFTGFNIMTGITNINTIFRDNIALFASR